MYTQNSQSTKSKSGVISFPNTESIMQMRAISIKEDEKTISVDKETKTNTEKAEDSANYLLLFGLILSFTDTYKINSDILPLIAGIILSM